MSNEKETAPVDQKGTIPEQRPTVIIDQSDLEWLRHAAHRFADLIVNQAQIDQKPKNRVGFQPPSSRGSSEPKSQL